MNQQHTTTTIFTALRAGFATLLRYPRVVLVFWGASLLMALLGALPLRSLLLAGAGKSLMLQDLVDGFDYTFLNDFIQNYGSGFGPVIQQPVWMLVVQLPLLVFLTAGLTNLVYQQPVGHFSATFWQGAGRFFWRMLRLTLIFLVIHLLVLGIFAWLYLKVTKGLSPQALETEGIITSSLRWLVPLYLLTAAIPMLWQDYSKVFLVSNEHRWVWPAIGKALRLSWQRFRLVYPLYLLNMILLALALLLNYCLSLTFTIGSFGTIILSLVLSQLIVIARFAVSVINLGSIAEVMRSTS